MVHPGYAHGTDFDIGLVELASSSSVSPMELYEGGDLGYNDCNKLSYLTAHFSNGSGVIGKPLTLMTQKLLPLTNEACDIQYESEEGFRYMTKNMLCAEEKGGQGRDRMPAGSPLLVPWKRSATGWVQIGVQMKDRRNGHPVLYTRISEMLQWILSAKGLGVHPVRMLRLQITGMSLPKGTSVTIHNGNSDAAQGWRLDSGCEIGEVFMDHGSGAMLLIVEGPAFEQITVGARLELMGCADLSTEMMGKDMKINTGADATEGATSFFMEEMPGCMLGCNLLRGECRDPPCHISLTWPNVTAMVKAGRAFTGGLGQLAEKSAHGHYGVWMCARDWIEEEMVRCGVGPKQLACFRFEERSREFHFYGGLHVVL